MLSQTARYALHAMIELARRGEGASASVLELASARSIPPRYLEQVLGQLRTRGLVLAKRGRLGGYRLAKPASEIPLIDIMRSIDGPLALAPCASLTAYAKCDDCESVETCAIHPILVAVRVETVRILESTTLAAAAATPHA